jgi:hypothetical protein
MVNIAYSDKIDECMYQEVQSVLDHLIFAK